MLHQILATSNDSNVLAVACHDVGCFVRAHPPGKVSVDIDSFYTSVNIV